MCYFYNNCLDPRVEREPSWFNKSYIRKCIACITLKGETSDAFLSLGQRERLFLKKPRSCPPEDQGGQRSLCQTSHSCPVTLLHSLTLWSYGGEKPWFPRLGGRDWGQSSRTQTPKLGLHLVPSPDCEHAEAQAVDDVQSLIFHWTENTNYWAETTFIT